MAFAFLLSCGKDPCPASVCACDEEACDACAEAIADLDARFCETYLSDDAGWHRLIQAYHQQLSPNPGLAAARPLVDLYLDMSDGMRIKIQKAEEEAGLMTDLVNVLSGREVAYFKLKDEANQVIEALPADYGGDIRSYIRDARNYNANNNYAPLDAAVDTITRHPDRQSILITDGELARTGVSAGSIDPTLAWGTKSFKSWLAGGNRIDFIAKAVRNERLFFIIFTPRALANDPKNVIEAYLEATGDLGKREQFTHLKFTLNDYRLERAEDSRPEQEQGLNSTFVDWVADYHVATHLPEGYQHIHIGDAGVFKQYVWDFAENGFTDDFVPTYNERNKLFYNLIFTNEFVNYQVADLDLVAYDIDGPVAGIMSNLKCRAAKPLTFEDLDGRQRTVWCNPENTCQDTTQCRIAPESMTGRALQEVFTLHEESNITVDANDRRTARLAIRPAANFNPDALFESGALRIDIFIKSVNYSDERQNFSILQWDFRGGKYTALSEGIRQAMRELKPEQRRIFTYYLTFGNPG